MKQWMTTCLLVLLAAVVVGCRGNQAAPASEAVGGSYVSEVLDASYEDALDVGNQLALGTLRLEETEHTVTSEQAKTLLPLWQALQGGVTAEDEVSAVLKGIEGAMTEEQLATIADMALTQEDVRAWMEDQGLGAGGGFPGAAGDSDARATRQAGMGGEGMLSGENAPPDMATRMAEFQSMSEEEREAMRATAQAGGGIGAGRGGAVRGTGADGTIGGVGQARLLLRPLIDLLAERAG